MNHERLYQDFQHSSANHQGRPWQVELSSTVKRWHRIPFFNRQLCLTQSNIYRILIKIRYPRSRLSDGNSIGTKVVGVYQLAPKHGRSGEQLGRFVFSEKPRRRLPGADVVPSGIAFNSSPTKDACTGPRDAQVNSHGCLILPSNLLTQILDRPFPTLNRLSGI